MLARAWITLALVGNVGCTLPLEGGLKQPSECTTRPEGMYQVRVVLLSSTCGDKGTVFEATSYLDNRGEMAVNCTLKSNQVSTDKCKTHSMFNCLTGYVDTSYDSYLECSNDKCTRSQGKTSVTSKDCNMGLGLYYEFLR